MEDMVAPMEKRRQMPWRFLLGIKIANRRLPVRCSIMAHTLELGFTELELCSAKHCMESPFMLPLLEEPSWGGVTYDLSTIR